MSQIYIIAGPPGIGKSTMGDQFIDPDLDILNEDEVRFKYKNKGFTDYNEISMFRVRGEIRHRLIKSLDFALELNLGYIHQYEYILDAKRFDHHNKLNVTLFFSDSVELCQERAKERHANGLHLVTPKTISEMYTNTIPLLKANFNAVENLTLVNVTAERTFLIGHYSKAENKLNLIENGAEWFQNDLQPYIEQLL